MLPKHGIVEIIDQYTNKVKVVQQFHKLWFELNRVWNPSWVYDP